MKTYTEADLAAAIASAETKGWQDCLRNIRASVEGYPNEGGDIEVMTAIQKLIASAEARARLEGERDAYLKCAGRIGTDAHALNTFEQWAANAHAKLRTMEQG